MLHDELFTNLTVRFSKLAEKLTKPAVRGSETSLLPKETLLNLSAFELIVAGVFHNASANDSHVP
jgi:hypothetical protein